MARRRHQKGSLFLRGKHRKVWVGRWLEDERMLDGSVRRIYRSVVLGTLSDFPTRRLAVRELERRLAEVNSLTYEARPSCTFAEFASLWQRACLSCLKPSTAINYRCHLNKHLVPVFGQLLLRNLNAQAVQQFISSVPAKPRTLRNLLMTLRSMWRKARAWGYVTHDLMAGVEVPSPERAERFFLSVEDTKRILDAAEEPYQTLYWLAGEAGLRAGELFALRVEDLDLVNNVVYVRKSIWRGKLGEPKSQRGRRRAAISPNLSRHLESFLHSWRPNTAGLLFATRKGTPLDQSEVVKKKLHPLLTALEIPRCGFHAFRHGNATEMDRQNVPLAVRQERLGHSDPRLTLDTYSHAVSDDERKFAVHLGAVLDPNCPKSDTGDDHPKPQSGLIQ
jgi:integrase